MKFPTYFLRPALLVAASATWLLPSCAAQVAQNEPATQAKPTTSGALAQPIAVALPRALWVWDATVITKPEQRKSLFEFCAQKKISVIYVSVGDIFSPRGREVSDPKHVTAPMLADFLRAAHAANLQVEALDGDPSFALREHHAEALARLQKALDYNQAATPDARLDGFQWDTEPYGLAEFKEGPEKQRAILTQYLDSAQQMRDAVQKTPNLRLTYCIPWFFDGPERALEWNGVTKEPAFHLIDLLKTLPSSELVLMSYRDKPEGSNGSIAISRGEIEYASKNAPHMKVWVGQETLDVKGDPPSITFWQEGESALDDAARQIQEAFQNQPSFGGVAIHHWASYRILKPGEPITAATSPAPSDVLKLISPAANGAVKRETLVSGVAPVGGKGVKVSVAVKPQGDTWYEQGESALEADGSWSVDARFGGKNTPAGRKFDVRVRLLAADGSVVEEVTLNNLTRTG